MAIGTPLMWFDNNIIKQSHELNDSHLADSLLLRIWYIFSWAYFKPVKQNLNLNEKHATFGGSVALFLNLGNRFFFNLFFLWCKKKNSCHCQYFFYFNFKKLSKEKELWLLNKIMFKKNTWHMRCVLASKKKIFGDFRSFKSLNDHW